MRKIGEDVSERLEFVPACLQVIEEVRPKYACSKGCEEQTPRKKVKVPIIMITIGYSGKSTSRAALRDGTLIASLPSGLGKSL